MAGNPDAEGALGTAGAPVDPPPHKPVVAADYDYIKYLFSKDTEAELLYVLPVDEGGDGGSSSNGSSSPVRRHSEREQALVDVHAQVHATIKSYCASRTVTHHYEDLDQEMVMEYEGAYCYSIRFCLSPGLYFSNACMVRQRWARKLRIKR
jgi:hypothetical protein